MPEAELIVVDDGSTDTTAQLAAEAGATTIRHRKNQGYGAALRSGILQSTRDYVLFCDADGQHRIEDVKKVIEAYATGINYWMIKNPDNKYNHFFPLTAEDIVAGFSIQNLFFSGVVSSIEKLQREENIKEEYTKLYKNEQFVTGSNVLAVNSNKTSDGSTRIIIKNPQPAPRSP